LYPTDSTRNITASVYNHSGTSVATTNGTGNITVTYTPGSDGFYFVKIKNTSSSNPSQTVYVKVTYTSPQSVSTSSYPAAMGPQTAETRPSVFNPVQDPQGKGAKLLCYPDPFTISAQIQFTLFAAGRARLTVLDLNGRLVRKLVDQDLPAGVKEVTFKSEGLPKGTYIVRLDTPGNTQTGKIVLER
jgi:hypothetical protein